MREVDGTTRHSEGGECGERSYDARGSESLKERV